ncbi:MAG: hypothetical protein WD002_02625 [Pseudomonadales bacterium]
MSDDDQHDKRGNGEKGRKHVHRDRQGQKAGKPPSQIPLLVDIAHNHRPAPVRQRPRKKENLILDLNPEPPTTLDLFAGPGSDHPGEVDPSAAASDPKPDSKTTLDTHQDAAIEAKVTERFRQQANELVDNLVRHYSQEIVQRLHQELTALLDDLDSDRNPDHGGRKHTDKDDPSR